ncbi:sialidase family protein [Pedobacter nutrimenti]|uniref:sialidase family protein n=1 Tax=Pedobacter nutrimenti TaxID=1241337 RepID=UPI00292DDD3F|nr:sialidase family protein [Pedobacter nutrimenti]
MKKIFIILISTFAFFFGCKEHSETPVATALNTDGIGAVGPYFTKDNKGNPVLCWTEQDSKDSLYRLKYAIYNEQQDKFGIPVTVPASAGSNTSAESMGKIAFKADGTIMTVFSKRFPQEKNPYAGAIYYSMSADNGKNWTKETFLHSDTSHTYGRSFFDLAILKDGEVASIWLDGRFGKSIKGSALFFSRTEKGKGFGLDTCLDKGTCECCRTDILSDSAGQIHLAYRSIMFPSALSGKQVRDMAYKLSTDNGKTFSDAKTISKDNWEIEGCPHSGPSLAVLNKTVNAVWFTAGGNPGLYYASSVIGGDFQNRNLITRTGRHPQTLSLPGGKLAMVCEEPVDAPAEEPMKMDHSKHEGMSMGHMHMMPASTAKIILRVLKDGNTEKTIEVTDGKQADHHAVLISSNKGILLGWIREENGRSKIYYSKLHL